MAEPFVTFEKVKKTKIVFNRFHSDRYKRVKKSWRRPRGIDNRVRRKFRGAIRMPGKQYMNEEVIRHLLPNGYKKVQISTIKELETLMGHNKLYCAEIRHKVGAMNRIQIINRAKQLDILVTNADARVTAETRE